MRRVRVNKGVSGSDIKPRKSKHYQMTIKSNNSSGKNYTYVVLGVLAAAILGVLALVIL